VQVIGHRGAAALAPENTWAGFDLALELGVDAIETDVRATSDGVLVLLHDAQLDRTTNGTGAICETPWSAVRMLDAGEWFDERYVGARVPRLGETLRRYGVRTRWAIEIKQLGIEERVLDVVRELDLLDRVTFTSFDWGAVVGIRAACSEASVGYLAQDTDPDTVARVVHAGLDQFCPPSNAVSRDQVTAWKARGLEVRAWGVRDEALMMGAIEAGVDGMTVDFPHLLLEALGRRNDLP
jgi:glycerophosphoryl diester phosphodiesterase